MTVSPDSIVGRMSQQLRMVYQAETGRPLFAGLAEKMAQAAVTDLHVEEEHRTLTDGWIQPMWAFMRDRENRLRVDVGLPVLPDPIIREQSRWVTEWEDNRA